MAKADVPRLRGVVVQRETTVAPPPEEVNIKSYVDLLWVVGAGVLGFSLLCVTAGIALANPSTSALQPQSIIQIAIANIHTAAALTVEAFPQHLITPSGVPSNTLTAGNISLSPTFVASITPTVTASRTSIPLTHTRRPGQGSHSQPNPSSTLVPTQTSIPTLVPTQTSSPIPPPTLTNSPIPPPTITNTPRPTRTRRPTRTPTPVPPPTDTSVPPTDTSVPPTDTSVPPTDTSVPPTDTSAPPPPDTPAPPSTDTPPADAPTVTPSGP